MSSHGVTNGKNANRRRDPRGYQAGDFPAKTNTLSDTPETRAAGTDYKFRPAASITFLLVLRIVRALTALVHDS